MRVFVTGVCGQLGHDVMAKLKKRHYGCVGCDVIDKQSDNYIRLDITDKAAVEEAISRYNPDAVIHCAAWTAVDSAEEPENRDKVFNINSLGTKNIASACQKIDCKMVYLSTDYVFNGQGSEPWKADGNDYEPLNVYGQSKLDGELAVKELLQKFFIVRISWVFGKNGKNFINTMINAGKKNSAVRVINDQIGTPTYTVDLAVLLIDMIETEKYGYYHVTNEGGYISWYDFCVEIFRQYGLNTKVNPVSTQAYGASKAKRPLNSRLDKTKLIEAGFLPLPDWKDALNRYLSELKDE